MSISSSSFLEPLRKIALERFEFLEQEIIVCSSCVIDFYWNASLLSKPWLIQWNKVFSRRLVKGSVVSLLSKAFSEVGVIVLRSERCRLEDCTNSLLTANYCALSLENVLIIMDNNVNILV